MKPSLTCKLKLEKLESKLKSKLELLTKLKGTLTNKKLPSQSSTCKLKQERLKPLPKSLPTQPSKLQQYTPEVNITVSGLEINTLATVHKPQLT